MNWVDFLLGLLTGMVAVLGYLIYITNYRR